MKYTPCLNETCFFTNTPSEFCEVHHIFYGSGHRKLSEKYGMKIYLAPDYHRGHKNGVHHNREHDLAVKQFGQREFEKRYDHNTFMKVFGRNYL